MRFMLHLYIGPTRRSMGTLQRAMKFQNSGALNRKVTFTFWCLWCCWLLKQMIC